MIRIFGLVLIISLLFTIESYSQSDSCIVSPTPFSSRINDEFSPVYYKGGIVFCSDGSDNSLVSYRDENNRLFKIFFTAKRGSSGWTHPRILAKELTTAFNDGPSTFNKNENIIWYSRNNFIENAMRNISDTSNKMGIYSAELIDGIWTNINPFIFNNPLYSFGTPSITPDGDRIYFSSDMPGGYGGMDLYYCDKNQNGWDMPVNLGPAINTRKNESFPFACKNGKLYFSSDGHKGYGGKDIFYTQVINGAWILPVHLDSQINSSADDFGIVIDSTFENGFFSTNRRTTDDIYSFSSPPVGFTYCDSLKENNYCFTFYDEKQQLIDTLPVIYLWDFGEGIIRTGKEVQHCFPGPGKYTVRLTIMDELTGDTISREMGYNVDLENVRQAYINSYNIGIVDKSISFEGLIADLKGSDITDYFWDFGDGFKPGNALMSNTFKKRGDYIVRLGLLEKKDSLGKIPKVCVLKKIKIYNSYQKIESKGEYELKGLSEKCDSDLKFNKTILVSIYLMDDLSGQQKDKMIEVFKNTGSKTVRFDKYGINPASFQFLDIIAGMLKEYPGLSLEMNLHSSDAGKSGNKMEMSEVWAQELSRYFKTREIEANRVHSKGVALSNQFPEPINEEVNMSDGVLEIMFMKN